MKNFFTTLFAVLSAFLIVGVIIFATSASIKENATKALKEEAKTLASDLSNEITSEFQKEIEEKITEEIRKQTEEIIIPKIMINIENEIIPKIISEIQKEVEASSLDLKSEMQKMNQEINKNIKEISSF